MTKYCFDIDGTICTNTEGDYESAEPLAHAVDLVNELYSQGHSIILQTARGSVTKIDWRATTERQLKDWRVNYHELYFSKPSADVYVDDKAISAHSWHRERVDPLAILEMHKNKVET